jgi:hypothetical protein
MSEQATSQPRASTPSIPVSSVSDAHTNGHLVLTGRDDGNSTKHCLYIHTAASCTGIYCCQIFSYNAKKHSIREISGLSAQINIKEHGWFTDVAVFQRIAASCNVPVGQSPEDIFDNWQEGLLGLLKIRTVKDVGR